MIQQKLFELVVTFISGAILSHVLWGLVLYNQLVPAEKTLIAIPTLSLLAFLGNFYQKKPEPMLTSSVGCLGLLSAILQPAYMIFGK